MLNECILVYIHICINECIPIYIYVYRYIHISPISKSLASFLRLFFDSILVSPDDDDDDDDDDSNDDV
jgi:hypothetical protein